MKLTNIKNILRVKYFLIILIIMSCKSEEKISVETKLFDAKKYKESSFRNAKYFSDIFLFNKIIDLETNDSSLISSIEKIIYDEKYNIIIIHDRLNSNVLMFNINGKFIRTIGKKGMGPGEYFQPGPVTFGDDKIIIHSKNGKLLIYNLKGSLLDEINYRSDGWSILPSKMVIFNKDLFVYTTSKYYNIGIDNKKHPVFKILNCKELNLGFGKFEENYGLGAGDITRFDNRIIFTGIYSGNIYQILPNENETSLFTSLGQLYDEKKIIESKDHLRYIVEHMSELNTISLVGVIREFLCITKVGGSLTILDKNGDYIVSDLIPAYRQPDGYEGNALRLLYEYYNEGIIFANTKIPIGPNYEVNNPSLILYTMKKVQYNEK